jgi:hypothetical protein
MLKEYGFAASAWTNDRGNLALRTVEIDAVEDLLLAKAAAQITHDDRQIGFFVSYGQRLKATRQSRPDS